MKRKRTRWFWFVIACVCYGCTEKAAQMDHGGADTVIAFEPLFAEKPAAHTGIAFANVVTPNDSLNILDFNYFYNGGGVAVGDVNNDSLPDLFFTGNMTSSRLYLNRGNLQFEDATAKAGVTTEYWATGATMADVNGDGWLDIYVCFSAYHTPARRTNKLFVNNGDGTFTDRAKEYGLAFAGYSSQAAFLDYDKDGDLDAFIATVYQDKTNPNVPRPKRNDGSAPSADKLFRNNGNGTFTDVTRAAGIRAEGYGLGLVVSDVNRDGWLDLYVANDFIYDDNLYLNNRDGTFTDRAGAYFRHTSRFAMGTDAADINNDGRVDLVTLDMLPNDNRRQKLMNTAMNYDLFMHSVAQGYLPQYSRNTLQLNNGDGTFSEIGYLSGVYKTDWSWSALLADYDNDGFRDLLITNGIPKDITDSDFIMYRDEQVTAPGFNYAETKKTIFGLVERLPEVKKHDFIFKNNGDLTFSDQTTRWGLSRPTFSNGAAYADLDGDGDLELVINRLNEAALLYENRATQQLGHHFLRVALNGRDPLGAQVHIRCGKGQQWAEYGVVRGFQSTVEGVLHFGLGPHAVVDSLTVTWPDGRQQTLAGIRADQTLALAYRDAKRPARKPAETGGPRLFAEATGTAGINYTHRENPFVDFKFEPLLPHKYSQNGPGLAVGDVNGDGREDFCVGGPAREPGKLFLQTAGGRFTPRDLPDPDYEDMGLLLFDSDGDGDLDLYVVSGGNEFNANSAPYQDRLYQNDGKGNFTRNAGALPTLRASGSCVTAADYDQDGDLDLFVGGRVLPGRYPLPAQSYLLGNEGGRFTDVAAEALPALSDLGLVTTGLWTDFDSDGWVDLLVAGEWMPIRFFRNQGGKFTEVTNTTGLSNTSGWWNSLVGDDFDGDGDTDYVAGNLGLNTPYNASASQPVTVQAADVDNNGSLDPILSYTIEGLVVPVASRDVLAVQVPATRGRFPRYTDYAAATAEQVIPAEVRQRAYTAKSELFHSCYLENRGQGKFALKILPVEAQFTPAFGLLTGDYDRDGHQDILVSGNSSATEFMAGWYDAGSGLCLRGDGKGNFTPLPPAVSGFRAAGDCKGMVQLLAEGGNELVLVGQNNDRLKAFSLVNYGERRMVEIQPTDAWAEFTERSGRKVRKELYYGSGYLGQSSRQLAVSAHILSVKIFSYAGKVREVTFKGNGTE